MTSTVAVLSVLLVVLAGTVQSAPSGQNKFTAITYKSYLTYSSAAQRDVLLQQVRVIWQNVLQDGWGVTNVAIAFISEQDAQQNDVAPNSPTRHSVSYKISGQSFQTVDVAAAKSQFQAALQESGITGVQEIPADDGSSQSMDMGGSNDQSAASGSKSGQSQGSSGSPAGSKSFRITDQIVLTYASSKQRDTFLQQVLVMWRNVLNQYQASNVKVEFVSETSVSGASSGQAHVVKYRITGQSMALVDIQSSRQQVQQAIQDAHLSGISGSSSDSGDSSSQTQQFMGDASDSNDVAGGNTSSDSGSSSKAASSGSKKFQTTDTVVLTYTNMQQCNSLLQQILKRWQAAFSNQAQNVAIMYMSDKAGPTAGTRQVTYKITADASPQVDAKTVTDSVHKSLQSSKITGVQLVTDSKMSSSNNNMQSQNQQMGSQNQMGQQMGMGQKMGMGQQMGQMGMGQMGMGQMGMGSQNQGQDNGQTQQSSDNTSGQDSSNTDNSDQSSQSGDNAAASQMSQMGSSTQSQNQQQGDNSNSDSSSQGDQSQGQSFMDTDSVLLVYTSTQQRDNLLQQILSKWKSVLDQFQAQNVAIKFVKESPGSTAGSKQVVYRITAQSSQPIDVKMVEGTVHQNLFSTAKINGVFKLSSTEQKTFDSSSQNTDSNGQSGVTAMTSRSGSSNQSQDQQQGSSDQSQDQQQGGSDSDSSSQGDQSQGQSFSDTDSVLVVYTSTQQRDNILQQILAKWKSVLDQFQAQNVAIKFVKESPGSTAGSKQVVYRITAQSSQPIDVKMVEGTVHQNLFSTAKINGVFKLSSTEQKTFDSSSENTDSNGQSGVTAMTSQSGSSNQSQDQQQGSSSQSQDQQQGDSGSDSDSSSQGDQSQGQSFMDTDAALLTYTTNQQRDNLLQQILTKWKTVLMQKQAQNVAIAFVKELPGASSGAKQVVYRITAQSPDEIDVKNVEGSVHQSFATSKINGVMKLSDSQQQTFDASADNIDTNGQSGDTAMTGQMSQQGSQSSGGGVNKIMINDTISLSYKSTQQRDDMLNQILTLWSNALGSANNGGLKIRFLSAIPSRGDSSQEVTYCVSGKTGQPVDLTQVQSTFLQALQSAHINGVKAAPTTGQHGATWSKQWTSHKSWHSGSGSMDDMDDDMAGADSSMNKHTWSKNSSSSHSSKNMTVVNTSSFTKDAEKKMGQNGMMDMSHGGMGASSAMSADSGAQTISQLLSLSDSMIVNQENALQWMTQLWAAVQGMDAGNVKSDISGTNVCLNTVESP